MSFKQTNRIKNLQGVERKIQETYTKLKKRWIDKILNEASRNLDELGKMNKTKLNSILSNADHQIQKYEKTVVEKLQKKKIDVEMAWKTDVFDSWDGIDVIINNKSLSSYGKEWLRLLVSRQRPLSYAENWNIVYIPEHDLNNKDNLWFICLVCHEIWHSQNTEIIKKFIATKTLENEKKYFEIMKPQWYDTEFSGQWFVDILSATIGSNYLSDYTYIKQQEIALDEVLAREKCFNIMKDLWIDKQSILDCYTFARCCLASYITREVQTLNISPSIIDSVVFVKNLENQAYTLKCPEFLD